MSNLVKCEDCGRCVPKDYEPCPGCEIAAIEKKLAEAKKEIACLQRFHSAANECTEWRTAERNAARAALRNLIDEVKWHFENALPSGINYRVRLGEEALEKNK